MNEDDIINYFVINIVCMAIDFGVMLILLMDNNRVLYCPAIANVMHVIRLIAAMSFEWPVPRPMNLKMHL